MTARPARRNRQQRAAASLAARAAVSLVFKHTDLPIEARRAEIVQALQEHPVILVAGDTGSGKSTQLPQMCLEMGRGTAGLIAHTQPRRIAARALAARIAEELGQSPGTSVGFRVRFADQVSDSTRLQLMTDGLLLAELTADPLLHRYDTIIVDEAHERSLNVDLLLGVLKRLLPRRPDLKVIVTSATLDVERLASFFGDAPVIRVAGRAHAIETRYRPPLEGEEVDLPAAVLAAYEEIAGEGGEIGRGDMLVFLPGEREIRDVGEGLERELRGRCEVLPLYSRLSWEQQQRIFERGARQRIVLSTNVAETSITVPGIRSVIDTGLARISRYSVRSRLQRLPIEPVSRASAEQRKGRCGRVGPGLCVRLFALEEFEARPEFTEPEILRTNLAALLLRLAADGLGDAESFPFVDAPDTRALNDGYRLLQELEAFDEQRQVTRMGRLMARLPVDPRLARALLEGRRFRVESELLAITAGLSVPDVRLAERGKNEEDAPEQFADPRSEFMSLVRLWRAYLKARQGTRRELRQWCKDRRLSLLRLSEWEDVHNQLAERAREAGVQANGWNGNYSGVHRALLAGFSTLVGARGENGVYHGTRGVQFHLLPGSPLARRKARWVLAANIVETSRVFARRVAQIEPHWIESAAAHLLKHEYLEPDWDETREEVVAREKISFLGLIVSSHRVVNFGPIAPEQSRRIFAREALVYRRMGRRPDWLRDNDAAIDAAQRMEDRLRRRDLLQAPESFVDFYDSRLPRQVSSAATLEHFSRHLGAELRAHLTLAPADIYRQTPDAAALAGYPERAHLPGIAVGVEYAFAPGESHDGATLRIPLLALPQLTDADVQNAVPGLAAPRVEALLRSLPKDARRQLIPIPETARTFLRERGGAAGVVQLTAWLRDSRGLRGADAIPDTTALPRHLLTQLSVYGESGELARGQDVAALRRQCAAQAQAELQRLSAQIFPQGPWRRFELQELPERLVVAVPGGEVTLFPTLRFTSPQLLARLEWSAAEAAARWRDAAPRLARLMLPAQSRDLARSLDGDRTLLLAASPYFDSQALYDLLLQGAFRAACFGELPAPRQSAAFAEQVERGRAELRPALDAAVSLLRGWLEEAAGLRQELERVRSTGLQAAAEESRRHVQWLLGPTLLAVAEPVWVRQWSKYLKAERRRWQRNASRGSEPPAVLAELEHVSRQAQRLAQQLSTELRDSLLLDELRLWIEEYRVSIYAQELKTLGPVSAARLAQRSADLEDWLRR